MKKKLKLTDISEYPCYIATPVSGKRFDLQLYDGEFSPGMQNKGPAIVNFKSKT